MADESVYMDTEFVLDMSNKFKGFADVCSDVSTILDGAIKLIMAINLFGFGAATWVIELLQQFKSMVKALGDEMHKLSADVAAAREAFITGDTTGSKHFV